MFVLILFWRHNFLCFFQSSNRWWRHYYHYEFVWTSSAVKDWKHFQSGFQYKRFWANAANKYVCLRKIQFYKTENISPCLRNWIRFSGYLPDNQVSNPFNPDTLTVPLWPRFYCLKNVCLLSCIGRKNMPKVRYCIRKWMVASIRTMYSSAAVLVVVVVA